LAGYRLAFETEESTAVREARLPRNEKMTAPAAIDRLHWAILTSSRLLKWEQNNTLKQGLPWQKIC
jgi:hypothetical protein